MLLLTSFCFSNAASIEIKPLGVPGPPELLLLDDELLLEPGLVDGGDMVAGSDVVDVSIMLLFSRCEQSRRG